MDNKTKNKISGTVSTVAFIVFGIAFLFAIFKGEPWDSYIGLIIGFAVSGAGCSMWLMSRRKRK